MHSDIGLQNPTIENLTETWEILRKRRDFLQRRLNAETLRVANAVAINLDIANNKLRELDLNITLYNRETEKGNQYKLDIEKT